MNQPVVTLGVDLSAQDTKTRMATIEWSDGQGAVRLESKVGDERIVAAARDASLIAIDSPFGWPTPFVSYVSDHARGRVDAQPADSAAWRRSLANRTTDGWVKEKTGLNPLSVAADRIAHVAFRCANLLSQIAEAGVEVDRSGRTGRVMEVYPAAALKVWGYLEKSYKGPNGKPILRNMAERFLTDCDWLVLAADDREMCMTNDDAFDSMIASLVARAQAVNAVEPLRIDQIAIGKSEGWIALPRPNSLQTLLF